MKIKLLILSAVAATLAAPSLANAHVTVQPEEVPAGGFTRLDVRVPNERDDSGTTKVEVEMPDGFVFVSYEPVAGWTAEIQDEKVDPPIEAHGETIDSQVSTVTWTADGPGDGIQPGQFRDFGLSVGVPDSAQPGDTLTFPALQTYDNGEVVRWIGPPDSDEPAAQVLITEPAEEEAAAAPTDEAATASADADDEEEGDEGAPTWLAILGVVLGAAGVLMGAASLRRKG
jgi:periplasmic copper chaperone A